MTDQVKQNLQDAFKQLAEENQDSLCDFVDIQTMAHTLFQHETKRLSKRLGKEHPQVVQLKENTKNSLAVIHGLRHELVSSAITTADVPQEGLVIHGRVIDRGGKGIPGLSIYGEDENGKKIKMFGKSESNAAGYYALSIAAQPLAKMINREIYLAVEASPGKPLFQDKKPLVLKPGTKLLKNMTLVRSVIHPMGGEDPGDPEKQPESVDISKLRGVGPASAKKLRQAGIKDVQTFLQTDEARLKRILRNVNIKRLKREAVVLLNSMKDKR